jgi:hypothetical protein
MRPLSPSAAVTVVIAAILSLVSAACVPDPEPGILPLPDLKPPLVLDAGPTGGRGFRIRFDEAVSPVPGSFGMEPGGVSLMPRAEGSELRVELSADQEPGLDYALAGEVEDGRGNSTRFVFRFAGWNDRRPRLRISELQTMKNTSKTNPHRDYVELLALSAGNLGGVELSWSSSVKACSYRFPSAEVKAGEYVLLHLAPEGLPEEKDERGPELALSGGVDASALARDFWSGAGALPDENAVLVLKDRSGGEIQDGIFYAGADKSGPLPEDRLSRLAGELVESGRWGSDSAALAWEEAFRRKPSASRSMCRSAGGLDGSARGIEGWEESATGGQSPGRANGP